MTHCHNFSGLKQYTTAELSWAPCLGSHRLLSRCQQDCSLIWGLIREETASKLFAVGKSHFPPSLQGRPWLWGHPSSWPHGPFHRSSTARPAGESLSSVLGGGFWDGMSSPDWHPIAIFYWWEQVTGSACPQGEGIIQDVTHWRFTLCIPSMLLENKAYVLVMFYVYVLNKGHDV